MKKRLAILTLLLIATVFVARWSAISRRDAFIDLLVERTFAMRSGSHFEVDWSQE